MGNIKSKRNIDKEYDLMDKSDKFYRQLKHSLSERKMQLKNNSEYETQVRYTDKNNYNKKKINNNNIDNYENNYYNKKKPILNKNSQTLYQKKELKPSLSERKMQLKNNSEYETQVRYTDKNNYNKKKINNKKNIDSSNPENISYINKKIFLNNSNPKIELEIKLREEMRRLSIKYFKGRENNFKISNSVFKYIDDIENFVKINFPDYIFFLSIITKGKGKMNIHYNYFVHNETDGLIKEIYKDKLSCFSYLLYIKKRNNYVDVSQKDLENFLRPTMKKIIKKYLNGRMYEHKEFNNYVQTIGNEIKEEIQYLSKKVYFNNITVLSENKSIDDVRCCYIWLSGKNVHDFIENYEGQYSKCFAFVGSCIP